MSVLRQWLNHWHALALWLLVVACPVQAGHLPPLDPLVGADTRLMVFSPHPDDETLGAGGLMQRVLETGGQVRVVVMTNGDGFPEGVEREDHTTHPTATEYRKYGDERRVETLNAVTALGVPRHDVVFLGFPDGGLRARLWKFRADPQAYTSPFTLENHPPADELLVPHYDTQMLVMGRYLLSFARTNELYHVEAPAGAQELAKELTSIPCCWK